MPPDSTPPPGARPRGRHWEMLTAIASGFVAIAALATSTYNVYLQRQQVRAQVWPRLVMATDLNDDGFLIRVVNRGVGPAEIQRVRVSVDGKPTADWMEAVHNLLHANHFIQPHVSTIENQVLSPGLEIVPLGIPTLEAGSRMLGEIERLQIELCYCSTLGECWLYGSANPSANMTTTPIDACLPDPKPFESLSEASIHEMLQHIPHDAGSANESRDAAPE